MMSARASAPPVEWPRERKRERCTARRAVGDARRTDRVVVDGLRDDGVDAIVAMADRGRHERTVHLELGERERDGDDRRGVAVRRVARRNQHAFLGVTRVPVKLLVAVLRLEDPVPRGHECHPRIRRGPGSASTSSSEFAFPKISSASHVTLHVVTSLPAHGANASTFRVVLSAAAKLPAGPNSTLTPPSEQSTSPYM